jgi:hypothetical protein
MVNLRRQKLKAIRSGCEVAAVNKCKNQTEVIKLMESESNEKEEVNSEDGISS